MTASPLFDYTLRLADNALVLGHRLSEWCGHAPVLEEDLALPNMALDLIGQARALYTYAGRGGREGPRRGRARVSARCASTSAMFCWSSSRTAISPAPSCGICSTRHSRIRITRRLRIRRMQRWPAIAAKAVKEMAYHVRHASEWTIRLGDGTDESHARAQDALDRFWPFTGELFETDQVERALIEAGIAVDPAKVRPAWERTSTRRLLKPRSRARLRAGCRPVGAAGGIPSTSASFLPTCSSCSAAIRERRGDRPSTASLFFTSPLEGEVDQSR